MVSLSRNKYMAVKFMDPIALYLIVIVVVVAVFWIHLALHAIAVEYADNPKKVNGYKMHFKCISKTFQNVC